MARKYEYVCFECITSILYLFTLLLICRSKKVIGLGPAGRKLLRVHDKSFQKSKKMLMTCMIVGTGEISQKENVWTRKASRASCKSWASTCAFIFIAIEVHKRYHKIAVGANMFVRDVIRGISEPVLNINRLFGGSE